MERAGREVYKLIICSYVAAAMTVFSACVQKCVRSESEVIVRQWFGVHKQLMENCLMLYLSAVE